MFNRKMRTGCRTDADRKNHWYIPHHPAGGSHPKTRMSVFAVCHLYEAADRSKSRPAVERTRPAAMCPTKSVPSNLDDPVKDFLRPSSAIGYRRTPMDFFCGREVLRCLQYATR